MATRTRPPEPLRLIEKRHEFIALEDIDQIPKGLRGIYVLYRTAKSDDPKRPFRAVVYVGMSASGIKGRLRAHKRHKEGFWDCCSIFVVWPNVREEEIRELEGILRHIYRFDPDAQLLNAQGSFRKLAKTPVVELSAKNRLEKEYIAKEPVED
ncbi:hypothetical protein ACTJLD_21620 [Burkholderia sp. 22088]|uniref:hypothetical protein n=1 Tax=Burkholderia sp. 22088 TaxID=3453871 RepID=UPI003F8645D4